MNQAAIIIVNWNTGKLLAACVRHLLALPEQERISQVIIVDNASTDDSIAQVEKVTASNSKTSFVRSKKNLGFAQANNVGIKHLGIDAADHVLLLNPDTEMQPGSLKNLLEALKRNPKAGIIGPQLLNPDGSRQDSARRFPTFVILAALFLKLHRLFPSDPVWRRYVAADFDYNQEQAVDQVMGACFLIRRETLQAVGALDENFWIWFEEVDFCRRAKRAGWQTLYTPTAQVTHYGGVSFHQLVGWRKSWPFLRSALRYTQKHLSWPAAIGLAVLVPSAILLALPAAFAHRSKQRENQTHL